MRNQFKHALCFMLGTFALLTVQSSNASPTCYDISGNSGQLILSPCTNIVTSLKNSKMFPDVFSTPQTSLLQGLINGVPSEICFFSDLKIPAILSSAVGDSSISIVSASAWTNEFEPALFGAGTDILGSVITELIVTGTDNKVQGILYTRDTIDTETSVESDIVVGGIGKFAGARGAIKVNSELVTENNQPVGIVNILDISGTICTPG